ncbi:MAG: ATP-binding protein [Caulobacterales bacterium]
MAAPATSPAFDPFEAAPDPMAVLAPDGALLRANPAFRTMFRHYIGPNRSPWGRVKPPPYIDGLRRFESAAPDGARLEWIDRLLPDGASLIIARDVSRHVAANDEVTRAKTTLFATLTHELRTPLNGILGMAGLLAQAELEPSLNNYVGAIRESGEHLLDIITEILDYARLEAGRVQLDNLPFDPEATLQSVAELLSPKAHAKGIEIATLVRASAPTRVIGDDGRLRQILFNLAGNAVKFTEKGGVVLEMAAGQNGVRFTVRDTGPGVPAELQAKIFEEFAQADASTAHRHGGAGLGLAIVKRLAVAMGGKAGLVSRPGQGASFWVELPLQSAEDSQPSPSLNGLTIAVASASPLLAHTLVANLEALGASLALNGRRADVMLVDRADDLSEAELGILKNNARALIALTPQEDRDGIARSRELGVAHYMVKPVRRRALAERIHIALRAETPPPPPPEAPLSPLAGMRVLLAEDNPINALLARTLLTRVGCVVDVVGDGEEAVAAVRAAPYDIVFLDLRMPRLDGYGAAKRIRMLSGDKAKTPLVALTADVSDDERTAVLAAGLDDFVSKPIDSLRLQAVAARFTNRAKDSTFPVE